MLALVLALCGALSWRGWATTAVDLELVLAVDVSGSVDAEEAQLQRQGHIAAIRDERFISVVRSGLLGRIALAYVEWADDSTQRVVVDWRLIERPRDADAFSRALHRAPPVSGSYTGIGAVIAFARQMIDANDFQGARKVIDISGDGPNNIGLGVTAARDAAIAAGVTINGLPIIFDGAKGRGFQNFQDLDLYYSNCVIGGEGAFLVVAESFGDIASAVLRKMIREIAVAPSRSFRQAVLSGGDLRWLARARPQPISTSPAGPSCDVGERKIERCTTFCR